jgi:hypothetical protein
MCTHAHGEFAAVMTVVDVDMPDDLLARARVASITPHVASSPVTNISALGVSLQLRKLLQNDIVR